MSFTQQQILDEYNSFFSANKQFYQLDSREIEFVSYILAKKQLQTDIVITKETFEQLFKSLYQLEEVFPFYKIPREQWLTLASHIEVAATGSSSPNPEFLADWQNSLTIPNSLYSKTDYPAPEVAVLESSGTVVTINQSTNKGIIYRLGEIANGLAGYYSNPNPTQLNTYAYTSSSTNNYPTFTDRLGNEMFGSNSSTSTYIKLDFLNIKVKINAIGLLGRYNFQTAHDPTSIQIQGSNDNVNYTLISTLFDATGLIKQNGTTIDNMVFFSLNNTTDTFYKYIRLYMDQPTVSSTWYLQISEIELFGDYQVN